MDREKKLIEISKQILKDFEREYFPDTLKVYSPEKVKEWWGNDKYSYNVFEVTALVPDEQFGGTGVFLICFKDENLDPFMFHDGGAEGRVPKLEIIKKNGKYTIGAEWKE